MKPGIMAEIMEILEEGQQAIQRIKGKSYKPLNL
jgi:hypothetical protein